MTIEEIRLLKISEYDLENDVLYELCSKHPLHNNSQSILAKTILIGRSYSVSLDRKKNKNLNDLEKIQILNTKPDFYLNIIVPLFKDSEIDERIKSLREITEITLSNSSKILQLFDYLMNLLKRITLENKTSFCSKYLHFHFPNIFFIYDRRATLVVNFFFKESKANEVKQTDKHVYKAFFYKCFSIQEAYKNEFDINVTPRHLDNLFMPKANEIIRLSQIKKLKSNLSKNNTKAAADKNMGS